MVTPFVQQNWDNAPQQLKSMRETFELDLSKVPLLGVEINDLANQHEKIYLMLVKRVADFTWNVYHVLIDNWRFSDSPKKVVAIIGDDLTIGVGIDSLSASWPARLQQMLSPGDNSTPEYQIKNFAVHDSLLSQDAEPNY